jgi:hypothetical protein
MVMLEPFVGDRTGAATAEHVRMSKSGVLICSHEVVRLLGSPSHVSFATVQGHGTLFAVRAGRKGPRRHVNLLSQTTGGAGGSRGITCHAILHRLGKTFPNRTTILRHGWMAGPTLLVDVTGLPDRSNSDGR